MPGNLYRPTQPSELLDALQRLYDMHYALSERVEAQKPSSTSPKLDSKPEQGTPSHTQINGIFVQPIPPPTFAAAPVIVGVTLRLNPKTNQLEWSQ